MNLDFSDKNNTVPFPQSENSQTASALDSARQLTCGIDFLTDFWKEKYLQEYIKNGGSKIKFITGRTGSGKSHFLRLMTAVAQNEHYKTVQFSAKNIWMHDFKELYKEIFLQCGIMECLEGISRHLIREMGYDPDEVSDGMRFIDYLSEQIGRAHV